MWGLIIVAIIVIIVITAFFYRKKIVLGTKLALTSISLNSQRDELDKATAQLAEQNTVLSKCRGDLTTCEGKKSDAETQISALKAQIKDQLATINNLNARIDGYVMTINGWAEIAAVYKPHAPIIDDLCNDAQKLTEQINRQGILITQLNNESAVRNAKINTLARV